MPAGVRVNRALWTFRAIFALIALGLLAMILHPQAFQAQPSSPPVATVVRGHTAQGSRIAMSFDRPGHPIAFDTRMSARCFNPGRPGRSWGWGWGWRHVDGGQRSFRRAGSTLRAKQARGWVRMVATFYYAIGPTTCDSGRVPFAVGATSARPS
jgi:hypothetical protein